MAFTDPILAGEELTRQGIRSDNYVPGVSGWRIASNGAAEFDNIGVRGNLWVPSVTLNGQDLATVINSRALGLAAFMRGYPVVTTVGESGIITTEWQTQPGRQYEMMLANVTNDQAGTKNCEFVLRYTQGAVNSVFPYPDNGSGIVATSGRLSQFELATIRAYHESTGVYILRLRVSITAYSGTVRSYAPGGGCHLGVYDVGPSRAMVGTIGATTPTKQLKEWTITANDSRSYHQNGTALGGTFDRDMCQGPNPNPGGLQNDFTRGYCTFSATDISTKINDLIGVPIEDILICEWKIKYYYWKQGNGYALIGYHNQSSIGSTESGGSTLNTDQYGISVAGLWTLGMLAGSLSFVNALRAGNAKGLVIGAASGNEYIYQGIADGAFGGTPPQLHVKYYK